MPLRVPFKRRMTIAESKSSQKTSSSPASSSKSSSLRRFTFSSSLSGSATSLNSSSHSRTSSMHESPLSNSSSSTSLSSHVPPKQVRSVNGDELVQTHQKPLADQRQTTDTKHPSLATSVDHERVTPPEETTERRSSFKLNLISPHQIQQTARLGKKTASVVRYYSHATSFRRRGIRRSVRRLLP